MADEVSDRMVRICWSVARRYPAHPACGHEDLVAAALESILRTIAKRGIVPDALISTIARRAMIDELRRLGMIGRERVRKDDGSVVVRAFIPPATISLDARHGREHDEPGGQGGLHELIGGREDDSRCALSETTAGLTDRQRRICVLLGLGYSMREIGVDIGVTESRVSQIVEAIRVRIAAREATDARAVKDFADGGIRHGKRRHLPGTVHLSPYPAQPHEENPWPATGS